MTTTYIRILVVLASCLGGMVGSFVALAKLMPERSKIIIAYQDEAMKGMRDENKRLTEIIARLELRVEQLETSN